METFSEPVPKPEKNSSAFVRFDWKFLLAAAGIVGLAAFLRFHQLEKQEIWFDEGVSFHTSVSENWLESMKLDPNPPLYYLLLRGWVPLAGTGERSLRLPSALSGLLLIIVLIWAGRMFFDKGTGLWSGVFAAVAPMHIYYSQEARGYALLILLLLLAYVFLWRALQKNSLGSWIAFFACDAAAVATHYFAVLGLLPTVLLVLTWPEKKGRSARWLGYLGAGLGSALLLFWWGVWSQLWTKRHTQQADWIAEVWQAIPPALAIPKSLEVLALGTHAGHLPLSLKQMTVLEFPFSLRLLGLMILLLLAIVAAVPWGDARLKIPRLGRRKLWLASLALSPLVVLWAVSFFYKPVYLVGRYDMLAFPAFALFVGLALNKLQSMSRLGPYLALVIALGFFSVIGLKLLRYYETASQGSARITAELLDRKVANSDVVIFTGGGQGIEVLYQLYRMGYDDGICRNDETNRRFQCRMLYGFSDHRWLGRKLPFNTLDSDSDAAEWIPERLDYLVGSMTPGENLWVVLWPGGTTRRSAEGKLIVGDHELGVFKELKQRGLVRKHLAEAPWIVFFAASGNPGTKEP